MARTLLDKVWKRTRSGRCAGQTQLLIACTYYEVTTPQAFQMLRS